MEYSNGRERLLYNNISMFPMYYTGFLLNGKRHGQGEMRYFTCYGDEEEFVGYYKGNWENDLRQGEGTFFNEFGEIVKHGTWNNNFFVHGTLFENEKKKFKGSFLNDKKEGEGVEYDDFQREIRNGIWKNDDFISGIATIYYRCENVIYYKGHVNDKNQKHGFGTQYDSSGKVFYEGNYKENKKHGYGMILTISGSFKFKGEFENDLRHGKGIDFKNGKKVFEGFYVEGLRNGQGREYNDLGHEIRNGLWKDDNFVEGNVTEYYPNGNISYKGGKNKKNQFHGYGTTYSEEGMEEYCGDFKNGKRSGYGTLFRDGILQYIGRFKQNVIHGNGVLFYSVGPPCFQGTFVNGEINGKGKLYFRSPEEVLHKEGYFKRGLLCGKGIEYDKTGNIVHEGKFVNDNFVDEHSFSVIKYLETKNMDVVKKVPKKYIKNYILEKFNKIVSLHSSKEELLSILVANYKNLQDKQKEEEEEEIDLFGNPITTPCRGNDGCIYDLASMNYLFERDADGDFKNISYRYNEWNEKVPVYPVMSNGCRLQSFELIVNEN